jgi:ribonuclease HII
MMWRQGYKYVAGLDEVGRGALAGPVFAAAVVLPEELSFDRKKDWFKEVKDSKQLSRVKREKLFPIICREALAFAVAAVPSPEIDRIGIVNATRRAMTKAIEGLDTCPQSLLIDYLRLPEMALPQKGIVNGDCRCFSIACASIIAKVSRDRMMVAMAETYPGYGFAGNKGYGTAEHRYGLRKLGPSPIHRRSFRPVAQLRLI